MVYVPQEAAARVRVALPNCNVQPVYEEADLTTEPVVQGTGDSDAP